MTLQIPLRLLGSTLLGFFIAGAVIFPLLHGKLFSVIITMGIAAVLYGFESIVAFGHITGCSNAFLSFADGKCVEHSVRLHGVVLASIFLRGLRTVIVSRPSGIGRRTSRSRAIHGCQCLTIGVSSYQSQRSCR